MKNLILNIISFFCKPYTSYTKGAVENINGLIRRIFPKGTKVDTITEKEIAYVENLMGKCCYKFYLNLISERITYR